MIKRFIMHSKKCAFIVEHDFIMATYLADRVIVYDGRPGVTCTANTPQALLSGMNRFLEGLAITFRRDPENHRCAARRGAGGPARCPASRSLRSTAPRPSPPDTRAHTLPAQAAHQQV